MQWDDVGFLISKNKYKENSVIAEFYSLNHGKCSGIIYGGTSRKIKNYLQLGNKVSLNFRSKNLNSFGYFQIEILDVISPHFFDNHKKILTLISFVNLIKILTPDLQKNINIYNQCFSFLNILKNKNDFIFYYLLWEINFLKEIGYDLNLKNYYSKNLDNNSISSIILDNEKIKVPNFLLNQNFVSINKELIYLAFKFMGNYMYKQIFKPNNISYSIHRKNLENIFKN